MLQRFSIVFTLALLLHSDIYSQKKDSLFFTENLSVDLFSLLKDGFTTYDVMNGIKPNPKLDKLTTKLKRAIEKNYDWYIDHVAKVPDGEPLPYHENLGLSQAEYEEFLNLAKNITSISTGKITIVIAPSKESGRIHIKFPEMDALNISLKDSSVLYKDLKLKYSGIVHVNDDSNGLRTRWAGHSFLYENPSELSSEQMKNLDKLNYIKCKLTIALLQKSNKIMIDFSETKISNGVKILDSRMPLVYSDDQSIIVNK